MAHAIESKAFDICAVILLLLAYWIVHRLGLEAPVEIGVLVPAEAIFFAEQDDPFTAGQELLDTPLAKKLLENQANQGAAEYDSIAGKIRSLTSLLRVIDGLMADQAIRDLRVGHLALALLAPEPGRPLPEQMKEALLENVVLWCRFQMPQSLSRAIDEALRQQDRWREVASSQYGNHRIRRLQLGSLRVSLVALGETLALSSNERHLRHAIDVFDRERPSLSATAPNFLTEERGQHVSAWRRLFVKTEPLANLLARYGTASPFGSLFDTMVYRQDEDRDFSRHRLHLTHDPLLSQGFAGPCPNDAGQQTLAAMEPRDDVMLWLWSNCLRVDTFLDTTGQRQSPSPYSDVQEFANALHQVFRDLARLSNGEVLVVADDNSEEGPLHVPLVLLATSLQQPWQMVRQLEMLASGYQIPMTKVEHGSLHYWFWSQGPAEGYLPLYGTVGSTFFLGNSRSLVQRLYVDPVPLDSAKPHGVSALGRPTPAHNSNLVLTVDQQRFLVTAKKLLEVVVTLTALEDRQLALQYGELFDTLLAPLLESWQGRRRSLARVWVGVGSVEAEMVSFAKTMH